MADLAAAGHPVRALTRSPRTATFPAGVESCDSAHPDLDGVTSVFVNPAALWRSERTLFDAARAAGDARGHAVVLVRPHRRQRPRGGQPPPRAGSRRRGRRP
ncbi:hypothetical protein [Streptomyces sp. NPDC008150]|uniref:hypothetical protein n=1 Tax=Streptomyces sp. NPDC008150 TaxID=3364816 RepID=UPI0036ED5A2C